MMQGLMGSSPQQFVAPSHEMAAPKSSGGLEPAFTGQGRGPGASHPPASEAAQPNHGFIRPQFGSSQNFVDRLGDPHRFVSFGHDRGFDHDCFHHGGRRFIIVFVNGFPCWYPVYTDHPYYGGYSDVPPPSVYDNGYTPMTTVPCRL